MEARNITKEIRMEIKAGDVNRVRFIIDEDRSRLKMITSFGTLLHEAANFGKLEIVKLLVEMGIDISRSENSISGGGAIHSAASYGKLEIVQFLLNHDAELETSESVKNPLFAAIHGGHLEIARLLIERGIDTRVKYSGENMKNMDALAFAEEWGRTDIVKLIKASQENRR